MSSGYFEEYTTFLNNTKNKKLSTTYFDKVNEAPSNYMKIRNSWESL